MATDIILVVAAPIIESLVDPIKRQVSYLCCYSCNVKILLDHEIPELSTVKESVQRDVDAARNNLEDMRPEVESWLSKVEEVQTKSLRIRGETVEVKRSCLSKWCPMMHYSLSRQAQKTTEASLQLRQERKTWPNKISNPVNPADLPPLSPTSEIGFRSRDSIEKDIMDALKDDSVYQIGLCGMGGIGKTTMARKIERWAREKREDTGPMFKHVAMVVVSQQPNPSKIQKEIAEVLGLNLEQFESAIKRSELLHKRLKDEKNALIILDDVWEPLKLKEELGIPTHVGCKLILTSRNQKALPLRRHDAKLFSLELLDDKESWVLFMENAGNEIDSPDLRSVAEDIVKECNGLPLALVVLGSALRGERKSSWEDALLQLQQQSVPGNIQDDWEKVYRPLLLSFHHLQSEEQRNLFLLCCLFPEDYVISLEELVHYGLGLVILEGISNLRQARKRVESILEKLISRSLLIESSDEVGNLHVKMHDVIRDVGIWIASSDNVESKGKHLFFISHGFNGRRRPKEDDSCTCISLTSSGENIIHALERANCTKLQLLRIYGDEIYEVPENLFSGMRGLKVLEASKLSSLPSSVHLLNNLRTLHLVKCKLEMISAIGQLNNLQILSLKNCEGEVLPQEIGGLKRLRKLDVTECWGLRRIAFGVISGLVQLEELIIFDNFKEWESEGEDHEITNAKLEELDFLKYLTVLCIQIEDPNALPKERPRWTQMVTKYHINVSSSIPALNPKGFERAILVGNQAVSSLEDWFYGMASDADYLDLHWDSCSNIMQLLAPLGYPKLKYFKLSDFENFTSLDTVGSLRPAFVPARQAPSSPAPTEGKQYGAIFPILKHLDIRFSNSLQEISSGQPPLGSFQALEEISLDCLSGFLHLWSEKVHLPNLRTVRISECERLSYLFPLSVAQSLAKLEVLEVSFCPMIEEIFRMKEGQMEIAVCKIEFPKLDEITLQHLPNYCSFCKGVDGIEAPALTKLQINNLPSIAGEGGQKEFLFDPQVAGNNLVVRLMRLSLANFSLSSKLQELEITSVHNFKSLFSPSILNGFPSLKVLVLRDCKMMEEVISKEEGNVEEAKANRTLFPHLHTLILSGLPKILAFCHMLGNIEFPSLEDLRISQCPAMKTLVQGLSNAQGQVFFSKEVFCPKLKTLDLEELNIVKIWSDRIPIDNFCGLEYLTVRSCPRMTNLFSPALFRSLTSIYELILVNCEELEEVIAKEEEEEEEEGPSGINQTLSPRLRILRLESLPKMRNLCHLRSHLQLPSLEYVSIHECPMLERFSQGPLHLPSLKGLYGLLDTNFAAKFFFNKEIPSNESHLNSNCFTIPASDLILSNPGSFNLFLEPDTSDSFVSVLRNYGGVASGEVKIKGNFDITKLQAGIVYEIFLILMLAEYSQGWEKPIDLELTKPGGGLSQHRTEILEGNPKDEWFEISVGEFTREQPHQFGHIEFSLAYFDEEAERYGLLTKGVTIRIKS